MTGSTPTLPATIPSASPATSPPTRLARPGRRRRRLAVAALVPVLSAVALAAGCGVPIDDAPRAISRTTVDPSVDDSRVTPTTSDRPGAVQVTAYFIGDQRLVGADFPVDDDPTLHDALAFTLGEPPPELTTALPSGTQILSAEVVDAVAAIDLTSEINDISGQSQKQAYAQLAFTAFTFADVVQVQFMVDGEMVDAPTDNGNKAIVTPSDFSELRPSS